MDNVSSRGGGLVSLSKKILAADQDASAKGIKSLMGKDLQIIEGAVVAGIVLLTLYIMYSLNLFTKE